MRFNGDGGGGEAKWRLMHLKVGIGDGEGVSGPPREQVSELEHTTRPQDPCSVKMEGPSHCGRTATLPLAPPAGCPLPSPLPAWDSVG